MNSALFRLTLDTDVVVTERFAAQGSYPGLPFLPGNLFLGVSASRLYDKLSPDDASLAFHSGRVRFGAAYPIFAGAAAFPVPFSWFIPKGDSAVLSGDDANVTNLLRREHRGSGDDPKLKQLRDGYFTVNGTFGKPDTGYRLKTAIDRTQGGRAKERQLFGYEHLAAGSDWWFTVSADDVVSSLWRKIVDSLGGRIRIGRSRSAEYGTATVSLVPLGTVVTPACVEVAGPSVVLYCLSDLALSDPATGNPTVVPCGAHLGEEFVSLKYDASRSYLRTRVYTTFNGKRRAADLERQVIERGSVLVLTADTTLTPTQGNATLTPTQGDALRLAGDMGIGMYRQEGLGRFLVEPAFLKSERFAATPLAAKGLERAPAVKPAHNGAATDLLLWLQEKHGIGEHRRLAESIVEGWVTALLPKVRDFGGAAPSTSQWSRLRAAAGPVGSISELVAQLGKICAHGVSQKQWATRFEYKDRWLSFADFLCGAPDQACARKDCDDDLALYRDCVRLLGERMAHRLNQERANAGGI